MESPGTNHSDEVFILPSNACGFNNTCKKGRPEPRGSLSANVSELEECATQGLIASATAAVFPIHLDQPVKTAQRLIKG